jgi:hypothetical protein
MLMVTFRTPQSPEDIPIYNGRGCTLLELSQGKYRWPISNPVAEDFCFCGNEPVKGLPLLPGVRAHCISFGRSAGRVREHQRSRSAEIRDTLARLHSIISSAATTMFAVLRDRALSRLEIDDRISRSAELASRRLRLKNPSRRNCDHREVSGMRGDPNIP